MEGNHRARFCSLAWILVGMSVSTSAAMAWLGSRGMHRMPSVDPATKRSIRQERAAIAGSMLALGGVFGGLLWAYQGFPVCAAVGVAMSTMHLGYRVFPKSQWLLEHAQTAEDARAWLRVYRVMNTASMVGAVLGAAGAVLAGAPRT